MKNFVKEFKNLDKSIVKVMRSGVRFSFVFCLYATLFLAIYQSVHIPNLFRIGILLFKSSLFFLTAFIAYGFIFNKMKQIMHS